MKTGLLASQLLLSNSPKFTGYPDIPLKLWDRSGIGCRSATRGTPRIAVFYIRSLGTTFLALASASGATSPN